MDGGLLMDIVKAYVDASSLIGLINIPSSLYGKKVEVTVREIPTKSPTPITDKFAGIASGLGIKAEDVRCERLGYGTAD